MASDKVSVEFRCTKCGGKELTLPDNPTDSGRAICSKCGVDLGSWGDIKSAAVQTVGDDIIEKYKDTLASAFKGNKNVTFKPSPRKRR